MQRLAICWNWALKVMKRTVLLVHRLPNLILITWRHLAPHAHHMVAAAVTAGMDQSCAKAFSSKEKMADWLIQLKGNEQLSTGDWLLIKGSRGMQMETVLELLQQKMDSNLTAGN